MSAVEAKPTRWSLRTEALPDYRPDADCPKCGGEDVSTVYRPGRDCDNDMCSTCPVEHLLRTCRRCYFQWAEAVES